MGAAERVVSTGGFLKREEVGVLIVRQMQSGCALTAPC